MPIHLFDPLEPAIFPRFSGSSDFQFIRSGKVRVTTGSRLHFGFLNLTPNGIPFWNDLYGYPSLPVRRFGGIGLMIPHPGTSVLSEISNSWAFEGTHLQRVEECALKLQAYCDGNGFPLKPCKVVVEKSAPHHVGLGTGTQLALALGKSLLLANGFDMPTKELGPILGRGNRSAIGLYGFDHGGLIVEGGKTQDGQISPLVSNLPWPPDWQIELQFGHDKPGVHGVEEVNAFKQIMNASEENDSLSANPRNALLGILPAIVSRDIESVKKFIFDMNMRTGKAFEPFEGKEKRALQNNVNEFCGQSSWGPVKFQIKLISH
jgi:beta-ribofuranosylaminobenzene 5'-phosphate synthase